jgi:hypothetical protein
MGTTEDNGGGTFVLLTGKYLSRQQDKGTVPIVLLGPLVPVTAGVGLLLVVDGRRWGRGRL